jgi:hypothetical protein
MQKAIKAGVRVVGLKTKISKKEIFIEKLIGLLYIVFN